MSIASAVLAGGVTAVLDLTAEFSEPVVLRYGAAYLNLPVLDLTQAARPGARARVGRVDVLREFEQRAFGRRRPLRG